MNQTDADLGNAGWAWALREWHSRRLLALTVDGDDAAQWVQDKRGHVLDLSAWHAVDASANNGAT